MSSFLYDYISYNQDNPNVLLDKYIYLVEDIKNEYATVEDVFDAGFIFQEPDLPLSTNNNVIRYYDTTEYIPAYFLLMYIEQTVKHEIVKNVATFENYLNNINTFFQELPAFYKKTLCSLPEAGIYIRKDKIPYVVYKFLLKQPLPFEVFTLLITPSYAVHADKTRMYNTLSMFGVLEVPINVQYVETLPYIEKNISNTIQVPKAKNIVELQQTGKLLSDTLKEYICNNPARIYPDTMQYTRDYMRQIVLEYEEKFENLHDLVYA